MIKVAWSYIKMIVEGSKWDDQVSDVVVKLVNKMIARWRSGKRLSYGVMLVVLKLEQILK